MFILSLFDYTGYAVAPFTAAGHKTIIVDILHKKQEHPLATATLNKDISKNIEYLASLKPDLIFSFPPCTDLAASGAGSWKKKASKNPNFQLEAVEVAKSAKYIADICGAPYFIENPVGRLSTLWRKYNFSFHPHEYGGYLPEDDKHPKYAPYFPSRDAYRKQTNIWTGNGFIEPLKKPVPYNKEEAAKYMTHTGGTSQLVKTIRSCTPRGFAQAIYETYKNMESDKQLLKESILSGQVSPAQIIKHYEAGEYKPESQQKINLKFCTIPASKK